MLQKNCDWLREVPGLSEIGSRLCSETWKDRDDSGKGWQEAERDLAKRAGAILPEAEGVAAKERAGTISRVGDMAEQSVKNQQRMLEEGGRQRGQATKAAAAPAENLKAILHGWGAAGGSQGFAAEWEAGADTAGS